MAIQDQVTQGSAADPGKGGHHAETNQVHFLAAGNKASGCRKNRDTDQVQNDNEFSKHLAPPIRKAQCPSERGKAQVRRIAA